MADDYAGKTAEELLAILTERDAHIGRVNAESAERRKKLEAYEKADKERSEKELSEAQRLQKELETERVSREAAETELQAMRIRTSVQARAAELGFVNLDDAYTLADLSSVEITEDGKVKGFEKSLEALAKSGRLPMRDAKQSGGIGTPRKGQGTLETTKTPEKPPVKIRV